MRVLVSGASGFIGRHVTRALIDRGDAVVAVCRPGRTVATREIVGRPLDVIEDPGTAARLASDLAPLGIDATLHLAGRLDPDPGLDELDAVVEANIGFPTRLAAAVAATIPGSVFVTTGTIWEYAGPKESGASSIYAATKRAFGEVLGFYGRDGLEVRTIVLPWVYGPEQPESAIVPLLVNALATGESLDASSGVGVLDLVYIEDVVNGLLTALDSNLGAGRWALSSGRGLSVRGLSERIGILAGEKVPVRWGVWPDRRRQILALNRPAPLLPGWRQSVGLDEGLRELLTEAGVLTVGI